MFPIVLDLSRLKVLLVGNGPQAVRRLTQLLESGVGELAVFADQPSAEMVSAAGQRLQIGLPEPVDFTGVRIAFLVDPPDLRLAELAAAATAAGALVNVEDNRRFCDFHTPSMVRRGDLLIAVSTNGCSPTLASRLRRTLEAWFPAEWATRLAELGAARNRWRAEGADMATVARRSDDLIDARGWLPAARPTIRALTSKAG